MAFILLRNCQLGHQVNDSDQTYSFQSPSTFFKGMSQIAQHVVKTVRGMFMRKIHRQPEGLDAARAPPMIGPTP